MRILFIGASNIGRGGRSTIIYNLSKHLPDTCICDFFCDGGVKPSDEIIKDIQNRNGHVFTDKKWENNYIKRQWIWFSRLRQVLRQNLYDIVHINVDHAVEAIRAIIGCRVFGKEKIVVHAHTSRFMKETGIIKRKLAKKLGLLLFVLSDEQIACSQNAAEFMYGKNLSKVGKVILLNNGIDVKKYQYDPDVRYRVRKEYSLEDKFVVGHVGNFYYPKNHERLVYIFKKIHERENNAILLLVGDGKLRNTIYELVSKENLLECVFFLGERNDVSCLLQAFDVFVLPSYFEGMPIAGIEAQAAGLPCFFSDTITKEVKITKDVKYISLNAEDDVWATEIMQAVSKKRLDESGNVSLAGFDIIESADRLFKIYCNILD